MSGMDFGQLLLPPPYNLVSVSRYLVNPGLVGLKVCGYRCKAFQASFWTLNPKPSALLQQVKVGQAPEPQFGDACAS